MSSPNISTKLPGPEAKAWLEKDAEYVSPSYGRPYPLVAKSGKGLAVTDVDGNVFLDFSAGIAVCSTGHCHPVVVEAIKRQAETLIHMSGTDFYYREQAFLGEEIARITPGNQPKKCFFGNSGADAVEAGFKLARYHSSRPRMVAFSGAFHGRTFGALSLTGSNEKYRRGFAPLVPDVTHVPFPYCYRCPFNLEHPSCGLACIDYIQDEVFSKYVPPSEVAAIVAEPIQGEGGYIPAPPQYFKRLKSLCDDHGILFMCDEVQSGFGRSGKMFAIEHWDVVPDIVCMAKGIASGMPLGVCCSSSELMNWHQGAHASTFGANPVSCAAAFKTIELLEGGLIENAADTGAYLKSELESVAREHDIIGDVRGMGLMIGVEFIGDSDRSPAPDISSAVIRDCFEKGIALLPCGKSVVRFCPPLVVTKEECDYAVTAFREAVEHRSVDF